MSCSANIPLSAQLQGKSLGVLPENRMNLRNPAAVLSEVRGQRSEVSLTAAGLSGLGTSQSVIDQSAIRNPQSAIDDSILPNPQSAIANPQSPRSDAPTLRHSD